MSAWDGFAKYCGVQGVIAILLTIVYVIAILNAMTLPDTFANIMMFVYGYYFAKNGVGIVETVLRKRQ